MTARLTYDPSVNAAYIHLRAGKSARTEEIAPGVMVDFADDGMPLGIEFLNAESAFGGVPTGVEFRVLGGAPAKV
ncbi:MAG TPA: DUF2283 domain-containing protein [Bacillota bacterium]|nr:DUF2283 domain-containing protein [Bacillota bacterium]